MSRPLFGKFVLCAVIIMMVMATATISWGQSTQGKVDVTVLDEKAAYVPGAKIVLRDIATNTERTADTQKGGTYSFVNLPLGKYKLTITKEGFETSAYDVEVQSAKTTSLEATLKVGSVTQVVEVGAASPVMDTTSNNIGSVINTKDIEDLPLLSRQLNALATLTPGYNGTWNGLPSIAQGNNVDGVMGSPSRMKFGGDANPSIQVRLENIEEMTVQTDSLDLNQGFGQSSMQINYTTRRGGNDFHGRLFEDFRNKDLNANAWRSNANGLPRPAFELNEFGVSVGGHVIKDKLFFFGSFSSFQQPGSVPASATVLTGGAQAGNYTYTCTAIAGACTAVGATNTVNLFTVAQNYNTANGTTLPTSINSVIGTQMAAINAVTSGSVTPVDPIINSLNFITPAPIAQYFPTFRVDYNMRKNLRFNFAFNETINIQPVANAPYFPGASFTSSGAGNKFVAYPGSLGIEWTISPTLVNQFNAGYLYNANFFGYNSPKAYLQSPINVGWNLVTSPQNYYLPVTSFYPVMNASDSMTWQHASHALTFGFSFYREQDHYWNPPEGINYINLGLVTGDPALTAFSPAGAYNPFPGSNTNEQGEAQNLYALLAGRISSTFQRNTYEPSTHSYTTKVTAFNLDELSQAFGIFAQDAWRLRPSLTINFGLRWDFTGANHDLNGVYHNADVSSIYGPSGINNLFNPGVLVGNMTPSINASPHPYNDWNVAPQPILGIAWSPSAKEGILNRIMGNNDTVIRAGFSLRDFTVPYQYFWDDASNFGTFFYQFGTLTPNNTGQVGTYTPGSLALGQTFPQAAVAPATFQNVAAESQFTFVGGNSVGVNGIKQDIRQPYTMAWNFGIQRKLGSSRALEVRYNGNRTIHQWISINPNEVNVFENGFLKEFINAQSNLAICNANAAACVAAAGDPVGSARRYFSDLGLPGQVPVPIMTGAFTGSTTGPQNNPNFRGSGNSFITNLNTGAVGSFASSLTRLGGTPYFCNLVGASFAPCATNAGYVGAGAGFPINFFQANPYASGSGTGLMTDSGYSNYNSLQVDFRQRQWHGVDFDANYTWSHTLGVSTPNDWTGAYPAFSLRNLRYGYGPTLFDIRHVVHIAATADLPFGKGRMWLNHGGVVDKVIGGWNVGTIFQYQSGTPFRISGGFSTFNNIADGGVVLSGITKQQLQSDIGVYRVPGANYVTMLPVNLLQNGQNILSNPGNGTGGANTSFIVGNTTPGIFTSPIYLTGPHAFFDSISVSKIYPITERWKFSIQAELLNAFNHPVFNGTIGGNVRSSSWAETSSGGSFGRQIELRGNITF
jgi:Carboxypeptidase regulatory-like domain